MLKYHHKGENNVENGYFDESLDELAEATTTHSPIKVKESSFQLRMATADNRHNKTVAEMKRLAIQTHKLKACNAESHFYIYDLSGNYLLVCRGICYDAENSKLIRCCSANNLRRFRAYGYKGEGDIAL